MMTSLKSQILVAGALAVLAGGADAALVTGLVNHWKFDNNLTDSAHGLAGGSSSVANTGTFAGASGTAGITYGAGLFGGNGISLDGAAAAKQNNGHVSVPRNADTLFGANATNPTKPNTVTTSMWVTVGGNDTDWQTAISHGEGNQYRIARRGNTVTNVGYAGGSAEGAEVGPDISGGAWHHISVSAKGRSAPDSGSMAIWLPPVPPRSLMTLRTPSISSSVPTRTPARRTASGGDKLMMQPSGTVC